MPHNIVVREEVILPRTELCVHATVNAIPIRPLYPPCEWTWNDGDLGSSSTKGRTETTARAAQRKAKSLKGVLYI